MSEAVTVSVIGIIGNLLAVALSYAVSVHTTRSTIRSENFRFLRTERQACYSRFVAAYAEYFNEFLLAESSVDEPPSESEAAKFAALQNAYSQVVLICAKDTVPALDAFMELLTQAAAKRELPEGYHEARRTLIACLRQEFEFDPDVLKGL